MHRLNTIIKNTGMLFVFNMSKIFFPLITLPYLTRVLSVECFAVVAYVKAVMQYMQIVVDYGFMLSGTKDIVLVRDDKEKLSIEVGNILLAKIGISLIALIILLFMCNVINLLQNNKLFTILSYIVVFSSCFFMDYLFRGLEIMEVITVRFVAMKVFTTILMLLVVKSDADILWIPILDILGSLIAVSLVWYKICKLGIMLKISSISFIIDKIKDSTIYFLSMFSTTAFGVLNTLVIGAFLSETQVAFWVVCQQLVSGVQSLYNPITSSIYPHMVKNKDISLINKINKMIIPILTVGCTFSYMVSDDIVIFVAGLKYIPAGELLKYLIPVMFMGFFSVLYGWPVLGAIGKQKEVTITTVSAALFQTTGLCVLYLIDLFTLFNVAILRCITEGGLFLMRYLYFRKFKDMFTM